MKQPAVYILSNQHKTTLYIGVTSNLTGRAWQHKNKCVAGFSKKYNIDMLVWYELHETLYSAISREKSLKNWKRRWKIRLIEEFNPYWNDLYEEILAFARMTISFYSSFRKVRNTCPESPWGGF